MNGAFIPASMRFALRYGAISSAAQAAMPSVKKMHVDDLRVRVLALRRRAGVKVERGLTVSLNDARNIARIVQQTFSNVVVG